MREQILTFLEKNSRIDPKELAILLGSDEVTIMNEIAKMEEEKVICGYHTLIDWEKVSDEKVTALIEVRVTPMRGQGFDSIAERIYNYPEVRSVYLISGAYDLMVILEGKTLKQVSGFVSDKLSTLDSVLSTATHFILKKYKDHGTIFTKKSKDERMLDSIALSLEADAEEATKRMVTLMEPLLIMMMAVIVGFIMIAVMLPIYESYSAIENS